MGRSGPRQEPLVHAAQNAALSVDVRARVHQGEREVVRVRGRAAAARARRARLSEARGEALRRGGEPPVALPARLDARLARPLSREAPDRRACRSHTAQGPRSDARRAPLARPQAALSADSARAQRRRAAQDRLQSVHQEARTRDSHQSGEGQRDDTGAHRLQGEAGRDQRVLVQQREVHARAQGLLRALHQPALQQARRAHRQVHRQQAARRQQGGHRGGARQNTRQDHGPLSLHTRQGRLRGLLQEGLGQAPAHRQERLRRRREEHALQAQAGVRRRLHAQARGHVQGHGAVQGHHGCLRSSNLIVRYQSSFVFCCCCC